MDNCAGCNKLITNDEGEKVTGLNISIGLMDDVTDSLKTLVKNSFGKYYNGMEWDFCFECFLNSLINARRDKLPF